MSGLPFRSQLAPFEREIVELRSQRPPVSYRRIVELLKERHGVDMTINGVFAFLRTRRKWDRRSAAQNKTVAPQAASQPSRFRQPANPAVFTQRPGSNSCVVATPKRFSHTFSSSYNLTRLTPEEKAALEKKLDDEQKGQS
mgnify:CR=1 FL=1